MGTYSKTAHYILSFFSLNTLKGTAKAPFKYPRPFYSPPGNLGFISSTFTLNFLSRLSSQSLHWRNESISFFRWVRGVRGAPVHQKMASAARVLSIKHVQLPRHLTAALPVQGKRKRGRARTVVVLLIAWHPRGLLGVPALTPVARVSVRELNYRSFFRSRNLIFPEKTIVSPVSVPLSRNLEYCIVKAGSNKSRAEIQWP